MDEAHEVSKVLLNGGVPILRCHARLKRPHADPNGSWDTINTPDKLAGWLQPGDNLAALLGWEKHSPVVAVGWTPIKMPALLILPKG
jgi:hypothetical protein